MWTRARSVAGDKAGSERLIIRNDVMPYFVYEIFPPRRLKLVDSFDGYREARTRARALRAALGADAEQAVRVIHAQSTEEAARLLTEVREARPLGEE